MNAAKANAAAVLSQVTILPDDKFVAALDVLGHAADEPEINKFIEDVRPRLRELRPVRRPTLKRLLCMPIEDLFVVAAEGDTPLLPRSAITPCWQLLQSQEGLRLQALMAALGTLPRNEPKKISTLGHSLWKLAAKVLAGVDAESEPSLALIGKAMGVAGEIQSFKQLMPVKPLLRLVKNELACSEIRTALHKIGEKKLSAEAYLLAVAARLESPGELFALLQAAEIPLPNPAARALGRQIIAVIVTRAGRLEGTKLLAPEQAAFEADRLARLLDDAKGSLKGPLRDEFDKSTARVTGVIQELLSQRVIDPAQGAIEAALGSADADRSNAEAYARALGRSRRLAAQVGLESRMRSAVGAIRKRLEAAIRAVSASAPEQQAAVYGAVRLVELVAGPDEAGRLLQTAQRRVAPV